MKKTTFLALAFALLGTTVAMNAQAQDSPQTQTVLQEKQKVTAEELPEAVKAAVENSEYKGFTYGEIYKIAPVKEGEATIFELQLKKGEQEPIVVRYDEAGNKVTS
ncbi:hypothetical protein CLV24_10395 [Pontibacter ummariensis]|uniref:Peptidase propeptide and YPEB domain-containing protein n=1 Tax=Pontibacter ummariensis TaxID=1610492 RepID=A0A239CUA0_9BACT|nr:hypothetical protein [Pontibacter ummariensis]PRY14858.1 hypothetical protein CLV24_10395 [Pontibacter ummariensis]SNS22933.1 hypothetical protein SAMN06296052_103218 [Pontibacter ummariensis]